MDEISIKGIPLKLETVKEIVNIYLDGIYNYSEISEMFYLGDRIITRIFNDKKFIETYFDEETYIKLKEKAEKVKKLRNTRNNQELVKNYEVRKLIDQEVLYVDEAVNKALYVMMLFIKFDGNIDMIFEQTNINKNQIINMLSNKKAKSLLLPEIADNFEKLFEIEKNIYNREYKEMDTLFKRIIYMREVMNYKETTISYILNLPINIIEQILTNSYVTIKYKKIKETDISDDEIKSQKILDMYDLIVNNDLPVRVVSKIFDLSEVTIYNYMNCELKFISSKKYNMVQELFKERNSHIITENKKIKINEMKRLYDFGYTINEIATEIGLNPSTVYRNLVSSFPEISIKMHENRLNNINLTKRKNML